jgi:DNA polymerase III alpha subunit
MLDKFNRFISTEETGIDTLYLGKSIDDLEFDNSEDIQLYNKFCNEFDINLLKITTDSDYDRINTYIIPEHYRNLDVRNYVEKLVSDGDADQIGRVEMELTEFEARKLFPVLRIMIYIIETMRKNNLVWGIGRGSSVASYVLYLIGVHKVDSLKYNLDIKEFLK